MRQIKVALVGNPNSGKTTLFNALTGLQQRVGNFPGVTVEKKEGRFQIGDLAVTVIDYPGCYSMFPNSDDERVAVRHLLDRDSPIYPDLVIYVADATYLSRHLLLATQVRDLGLPVLLVLNQSDLAEDKGIKIDTNRLGKGLGLPVKSISAKHGDGLEEIKSYIANFDPASFTSTPPQIALSADDQSLMEAMPDATRSDNTYAQWLQLHHHNWLPHIAQVDRAALSDLVAQNNFSALTGQVEDTMQRYRTFEPLVAESVRQTGSANKLSDKVDRWLTHRWLGPLIFFALMFLVFQAIFSWSSVPMDAIEGFFANASAWLRPKLGESWMADLLIDGVVAGIGGVVIFVPQIAILFFLLSILEEAGYMARAVYLFDGLMRKVGLSGRSVVALVSSGACAIPAIMSTRTIKHSKERLITILISPLISCSARIPVYVILVAFVVSPGKLWGWDKQGLAFMGLYLLSIVAALVASWVFKLIFKSEERSSLMLEIPSYKWPSPTSVLIQVWSKVKGFVIEAGKVIMVISIVLWALASFGPGDSMAQAEEVAVATAVDANMDASATADLVASRKLEASYAGRLGKFIEPVIKPLGYDWKIGIALLTSFAAREVFVGTMATIYSVGSSDDEATLRQKMRAEVKPNGRPRFDRATAMSLLVFYLFAMQCMSTLAVTYKETKSWKWPALQFAYMTALAYLGALLVYQLLS